MRLNEIEKLTKKQLRQRVDEAFELAEHKGPGYLAEAQFYIRELEHRRDSFTSIRDLVLEIVVIALIGWEIHMSYRGERLASQSFEKEQAVFANLEASSAATAGTLTALQETSKQMNEAVQKELALSYEVSLNVKFDSTSDQIIITNEGRTRVSLWGSKLGKSGIVMEKAPRTPTPGVPYLITGHEVTTGLSGIIPKGGFLPVPFVMFNKERTGGRVRGAVRVCANDDDGADANPADHGLDNAVRMEQEAPVNQSFEITRRSDNGAIYLSFVADCG